MPSSLPSHDFWNRWALELYREIPIQLSGPHYLCEQYAPSLECVRPSGTVHDVVSLLRFMAMLLQRELRLLPLHLRKPGLQ